LEKFPDKMTRDFRTLEKLQLEACEIAAAPDSTRFNPTRARALLIDTTSVAN
jgi:hypothetical protein